jgi:hypothetical protein
MVVRLALADGLVLADLARAVGRFADHVRHDRAFRQVLPEARRNMAAASLRRSGAPD